MPFGQVSIIVSKAVSGNKLTINRIYKQQCVLPISVLTLRLSDAKEAFIGVLCHDEDKAWEVKAKVFWKIQHLHSFTVAWAGAELY